MEKYLCPIVLVVAGVMSLFYAGVAANYALEAQGALAIKLWFATLAMAPAGIVLPLAGAHILRARQ